MYFLKRYQKEKCIAICKGPSGHSLIKSLTKGSEVTFVLENGRKLVGRVDGLEAAGKNSFFFGGDFRDSTTRYLGVEGHYDTKSREGFLQINYAVCQDDPVIVRRSSAHTT